MANKNDKNVNIDGRELIVTRTLNAPRDMVYKVWTDPAHIALWWGPNGFTNTISEMNVEPGGIWRYVMHGPDGTNYPNRIQYTEVVPLEKLVYLHSDDVENDPNQFHVTVTFDTAGDKTIVTMRTVFASAELLESLIKEFGVLEGGMQTFNRMEAYIVDMGNEGRLTIKRTFNAPRELVFKVWSDPNHLAKWWGPKGADLIVATFDFRAGGMFHYRMQHPSGMDLWAKFVYREIISPEKMVFVSSFSDADGGTTANPWMPVWPLEILNILTLTEMDGKTLLTLKGAPINASAEEIVGYSSFIANMEQGFAGTFDKLESYLEEVGG